MLYYSWFHHRAQTYLHTCVAIIINSWFLWSGNCSIVVVCYFLCTHKHWTRHWCKSSFAKGSFHCESTLWKSIYRVLTDRTFTRLLKKTCSWLIEFGNSRFFINRGSRFNFGHFWSCWSSIVDSLPSYFLSSLALWPSNSFLSIQSSGRVNGTFLLCIKIWNYIRTRISSIRICCSTHSGLSFKMHSKSGWLFCLKFIQWRWLLSCRFLCCQLLLVRLCCISYLIGTTTWTFQ